MNIGLAYSTTDAVPNTVKIACALCESTSHLFVGSHNGFQIVRCAGCGFVFVNPRPTEESLAGLYSSLEQNPYASDAYEPLEYERPVLLKILQEIQKYVSSGRLLEVGCARGDFLRIAKALGFSVAGCDIFGGSKPVLDGAVFYDGPLKVAKLPANTYDLVVIRNTLEHLFDPRSELEEIRRILKPSGYIYWKVPNIHFERGLPCRLVFGKANAFEAPYHLNHFSPRTLKLLLKRTGLEFVSWYVEQPTLRPERKANLLRQTGYRITQTMRLLTAGLLFPKILLSGVAQKTPRN
jgi:SAM-dependent methyltransferase